MSIEELAEVEITSVSKQAEKLSEAASSVFVITADDIRRTGATTLPEALRLAPNLLVARVDSRDYAISARGFNSTTANKLLVMLDGRIIYTPLFSGVFWDAQDTMLEDVDRIEVVSGPGATIWGSNAVNGVINIITRPSSATRGGLAVLRGGSMHRSTSARYGGGFGDNASYRIYAKYADSSDFVRPDGVSTGDDWHRGQLGFRSDIDKELGQFTVQGDAYSGRLDEPANAASSISGANLLARWTHKLNAGGQLTAQSYVDFTSRKITDTFEEKLTILDFEFEHTIPLERHDIIWGGGYRHAWDDVENHNALAFLPDERNLSWANLYAQDEIALLQDHLALTLGLKIEHNDYTGVEVLPSARIGWNVRDNHFLWVAASRAIRTPSRLDREFFLPSQAPFSLAGGPGFRSETADVLEIGYRGQPTKNSSVSLTLFRADYDRLRTLEPSGFSLVIGNGAEGTKSGLEGWASIQVLPNWRIGVGGVVFDDDLHLSPESNDPRGRFSDANDPDYQVLLRSSYDVSSTLKLDVGLRRVGELSGPHVPAYTELDASLIWRLAPRFEVALEGRDLLHSQHPEWGSASTRTEIPRSVLLQLRVMF